MNKVRIVILLLAVWVSGCLLGFSLRAYLEVPTSRNKENQG